MQNKTNFESYFRVSFHGMASAGNKQITLLRGLVSKETVVLRRWGSDTRKFGLSTPLINQIFVHNFAKMTLFLFLADLRMSLLSTRLGVNKQKCFLFFVQTCALVH